ncbi:MAG: DHH family phosphoesterase [Thaumarchaeota archaeon]|nr:DHH family phosphoesterase [Candidatus Calditenuaceae archaeon]MDW8042069.1 DHH family phosphoesterase [Nitrososphaerota archaeon]
MREGFEEFVRACAEVGVKLRSHLREGSNVLVVGHNDADALSALGIISGTAAKMDCPFTAISIQRIEELLEDESREEFDVIVLVDMGSGYLNAISEKVRRPIFVLDHHKPIDVRPAEHVVHVNPHLFGIDGSTMVSASGVAYLVAKGISDEASDYAPVAVVGALGDLQDKDHGRRLIGLNELLVNEAVAAGLMSVTEDLILYGRSFKPVHETIASTNSPFLPGLSGDETASLNLVLSAGIEVRVGESWKTLADLKPEEKARLLEAIASHLMRAGAPSKLLGELTGHVYELLREDPGSPLRDAREFATLLNACGKGGRAWVGIGIAMGVRGAVLEEAVSILEEYRRSISRVMSMVLSERFVDRSFPNVVVLRGGTEIDPRQVSSIASILSSSNLLPPDKPLVAVAQDGTRVKVSARASNELVDLGLDLGDVMRSAAERVGGRGGGHKMAAGAELTVDSAEPFLREVDRIVGEQVRRVGQGRQLKLL